MRPTNEQIAKAAYDRWQRRGYGNGDDHNDWLAAENDLLFALNYRVAAQVALDRPSQDRDRGRRRCRFCERSEPFTTFGHEPLPLPEFFGLASPLEENECDECRVQFQAALDDSFAHFSAPFRAVPVVRGLVMSPSYSWDRWDIDPAPRRWVRDDGAVVLVLPSESYIPIAAFKFLTRLALAVLPEPDLDEFAGAIEWVGNPDHDFDGGAFGGLICHTYLAPRAFLSPWISLAKKVDEDAPHPSLLAFVGSGHVVYQFAVPLGQGDADLDGECLTIPTVTMPGGTEGPHCECPCLAIPLDAIDERRAAVLELAFRPDALNLAAPLPLFPSLTGSGHPG